MKEPNTCTRKTLELKKRVRAARVAFKMVRNMGRGVRLRNRFAMKHLNEAAIEANEIARKAGKYIPYYLMVGTIY